jgi:hypothetical protein
VKILAAQALAASDGLHLVVLEVEPVIVKSSIDATFEHVRIVKCALYFPQK